MSEIEFVNGLLVKAPHPKAPDYVKCALSIKRAELIAWLSEREGEWVNIQVKVSQGGKWYAAVDNWKPEEKQPAQSAPEESGGGGFDDDIPFSPVSSRIY